MDKPIPSLDDLAWGGISAIQAARSIRIMEEVEVDPVRKAGLGMLRRWILRGYHFERAIDQARSAFADAERRVEE